MMDARESLRILVEHRRNEVVLPTMTAGQIWAELSSHELDLQTMGSMGKASSLALGLALGRPDRRVWVIDGDGSLLSNLGSLVTIGHMGPPNLLHFIFRNNVYEMSGQQPLPGAERIDFCGLARSAGYVNTYEFADLEDLKLNVGQVVACQGPALICLQVRPASEPRGEIVVRTAQALWRVKAALEKG